MPCRLRIEYPGAIYHVMARGNGRQDIVRDDRDRQRWLDTLERTVNVLRWELFAFVLLSNHFHLFLRTPLPNLSRGMQRLLSGYAIGWARRYRRSGHVFQGRFRAELIEDESYFWTVSRYLHLNPVREPVDHPQDWPWSSYPGYASGVAAWTGWPTTRCWPRCKGSSGEATRRGISAIRDGGPEGSGRLAVRRGVARTGPRERGVPAGCEVAPDRIVG